MSLKGIRKSDGTAEYIYADDTLSEENAPGEAKAAGDRIAGVEGRVTTLETAAPEIISNATKDWLDDNVTPTGSAVAIDSSLTQSGLAADAKAAGDAVNDLKSDLTHISNIVSVSEPQETLNRSGYAIYQGSDGWRFGNVGTGYDLYFFRMEEGYIYEVSFTGGQSRIGYTNYNPPTGTAYDTILISNGYTFEKHPTYNYFAIVKYGDSTVTITKRKKLTEVADATNLKHNITDRFTFTSGKCVIANSSNSNYGKVVDNATTDASNAALITDCNKLLINCATVLRSASAQNIGVCFYDGVLNVVGGIVNIDTYAARNAPIMVDVPSGAFYVRVTVRNDEGLTPFYCYGYSDKNRISASDWDKEEYHVVRIAASNASAIEKELADYVCTGTNDEAVIQKAIKTNYGIYRLKIELSSGDFYIDSFTNYNGKYIALELCGLDWSLIFKRTFCGAGMFTEQRTVIHVTQTALTGLGNNVGYVFSIKNDYAYGRIACYEDMEIRLADNQHKVIVIDNTEMSGGICKNIRLGGCDPIVSNLSDLPLPVEGCVGITGYVGDDIGTINRWDNIASLNFYEAFRMGGEHLICNNLTARNNYIGYTFGNYDWPRGTQSHPLTLINCCDEHNACLPKFYRSGNYDQVAQEAKQQVDLIGFNMELSRGEVFGGGYVEPSTEAVDGAFCGRIEFTGNGQSNVDSGETAGVRNLKAIKFWADGHGHGFRTVNMAHSLAGTTAERETYEPTYMQQYFDTTLNKMLIYNGSAWVDMNGNLLT